MKYNFEEGDNITITSDFIDYLENLQNRIRELEEINKQHQELNEKLREEKENLIKYLEDLKRNEIVNYESNINNRGDIKRHTRINTIIEILDKVREGKYD